MKFFLVKGTRKFWLNKYGPQIIFVGARIMMFWERKPKLVFVSYTSFHFTFYHLDHLDPT